MLPRFGGWLPRASLWAPSRPSLFPMSTLAHDSVDAFMKTNVAEDDEGRPFTKIRLPLPNLKGVVTAELPASASVGDLLTKLSSMDDTLSSSSCRVRSAGGDVVAKTSRLSHVMRQPGWSLQLGDFTVSAVAGTNLAVSSVDGSPAHLAGYTTLKEALLATTGKSLPFSSFRDLVQQHAMKAGVNVNDLDATLRSWSLLLHQDGVILHLDASPDAAVRDVVFLRPAAVHDEMQEALDLRGKATSSLIGYKEAELAATEDSLATMMSLHSSIVTQARRRVKLLAYGVGVFMIVQWGTIFHFVYEMSWDVMEPICYFIGSGYSILFYMFFMRTRQDPSTGNVFQQVFRHQQRRLQSRVDVPEWRSVEAFNEAKDATRRAIVKLQEELADLRQRLPRDV